MTLQRALFTEIFERGFTAEPLDAHEERGLIAAAQLGDSAAVERLVLLYAPALRGGVKVYTRALLTTPQRSDLEDVQADAVMALIEAIHAFDPGKHTRLAAIAPSYIRNAVSVSAGTSATSFTIPERTLKRFFGILRAADGDAELAAGLAPSYEMRRETFLAVLDAVRNTDSYQAVEDGEDLSVQAFKMAPIWDGAFGDAEDRILVEGAFRAVDTLEGDVCRLAYGFADYEPQSDPEVAERMGLSRPKVQRVRSGALDKMRSALGVA